MANVERLRYIRELMEEFKENFTYKTIMQTSVPEPAEFGDLLIHDCGSPGCVIGYCMAVAEPDTTFQTIRGLPDVKAREYLGLTPEEADWLFVPEDDPMDEEDMTIPPSSYGYRYNPDFKGWYYCSPEEGHIEALRRLDHLIRHYSK